MNKGLALHQFSMSGGFGLWGSSYGTNPAFAVDLSAAPTPAIRSQARHVVSDQLSAKHPTPDPAVFDKNEASIAYGSRGVMHNMEVLYCRPTLQQAFTNVVV